MIFLKSWFDEEVKNIASNANINIGYVNKWGYTYSSGIQSHNHSSETGNGLFTKSSDGGK